MRLTPKQRQQLKEEMAYLQEYCKDKPFLREALDLRVQAIRAALDERLALGFDWVRLAQKIADEDPDVVYAGFKEDLGPTTELVYERGGTLCFHHLPRSSWATPVVAFGNDGDFFECWVELAHGDKNEPWPDAAMEILLKSGRLITLLA